MKNWLHAINEQADRKELFVFQWNVSKLLKYEDTFIIALYSGSWKYTIQ